MDSNSQIKITSVREVTYGLAYNEQDIECDRRKEKWNSTDAEEEEIY
jgi:hypothetical protein